MRWRREEGALLIINLLRLPGWPILKQLQLEEALLRIDNRNWCIVNEGSTPAIVMGISGKMEEMVDENHLSTNPVPVIKRFSGGGTVFVDHSTYFVTFICNSDETKVACFPKKVLDWSEMIYRPVFSDLDFQVQANDYAIGNLKFGGNAQYMQRNRWLHHSTLLWDYNPQNMLTLKMPPRMPDYRKERRHGDFLCKLKDHMESVQVLERAIVDSLGIHFSVEEIDIEEVKNIVEHPHRKSTKIMDIEF